MINNILKYKYFNTNEDFVKWQTENNSIVVCGVFPVLKNIKVKKTQDAGEEHFCEVILFVTYTENGDVN